MRKGRCQSLFYKKEPVVFVGVPAAMPAEPRGAILRSKIATVEMNDNENSYTIKKDSQRESFSLAISN